MTKKIYLKQAKEIFQFSYDLSLFIQCSEYSILVAKKLFKLNPKKAKQWLKELVVFLTSKHPKSWKYNLTDIRDLYIEVGMNKKGRELTQKYKLDSYKKPRKKMDWKKDISIKQEWKKLVRNTMTGIESELFTCVKSTLNYAKDIDLLELAKNELPQALEEINFSFEKRNMLYDSLADHKFHLYKDYGILLLNNNKISEAISALDNAVVWAKKYDDDCKQDSAISWVAIIFCLNEMYSDVIRIMDEIPDDENRQFCGYLPFSHYVIDREMEPKYLKTAFKLAKQIKCSWDKNGSLDEIMHAYAKLADIKKMLIVAKEIKDKEALLESFVFNLGNLASTVLKTKKSISQSDFKRLKKTIKKIGDDAMQEVNENKSWSDTAMQHTVDRLKDFVLDPFEFGFNLCFKHIDGNYGYLKSHDILEDKGKYVLYSHDNELIGIFPTGQSLVDAGWVLD